MRGEKSRFYDRVFYVKSQNCTFLGYPGVDDFWRGSKNCQNFGTRDKNQENVGLLMLF